MLILNILTALTLLQNVKPIFSSIKCKKTPNCLCLNNADSLEFQCSPDITKETNSAVIHVWESSIKIDCTEIQKFDDRFLPDVKFENVTKLELRFCPLPENGITGVLRRFGVRNLEGLSVEYGTFDNFTLPSDKFNDLLSVKKLRLRGNDLKYIEIGFFLRFLQLESLELDRNNLLLDDDTFRGLDKLKFLSLSDNKLTNISRGLFDLISLEKLELWKNELTRIEQSTFERLTNLTTLELSYNKLNFIHDEAFRNLRKLANVSLKSNEITNISRKLFESTLLEKIEISNNKNINLSNNIFQNLENLRIIQMNSLSLTKISSIFKNSPKIETINLSDNNLITLPSDLFENKPKLKALDFSKNQISRLQDEIFDNLKNLEYLDAHYNNLNEINDQLLRPLINIKEINLSDNKIKYLHPNALEKNGKLERFFMRNNSYIYEDNLTFGFSVSPFNKCTELEILDLSFNQVKDFPEDVILHSSIRNIDLRNNNISSLRVNALWKFSKDELKINLDSNNITYLDFYGAEQTAYQQPIYNTYAESATVISINNNPIICDCTFIDFSKYIKGDMYPGVKTAIYIIYNNVTCASPNIFKGLQIENISPDMLFCPLEEVLKDFECSSEERCHCGWRPFDSTLVVDCSGSKLSKVPDIYLPDDLPYNQTEIHLEQNHLAMGPNASNSGYENATILFLNDNLLEELVWLPPDLEVLTLHNNRLHNLDYNVLKRLNRSSIKKLTFHNNQWNCDCSITNLTNYIRHHVKTISDPNITCHETNKLLINLNEKDLCPNQAMFALISFTIFIVIVCVFTTLSALYYKFQHEIKVWLYAHDICLWFAQEEELDKDKIYDGFVSYSHKDEDFVIENIISVLEGGQEPYKLCVHFRDWIPGEFIAKQVATSVRDSRRTVVILSPNFLESVWGKMEFRTAHMEAMREGRARVIVVLYGDLDPNKLDEELKAYMKTNTYIKWGDPWFWNKMKYAMPHSKKNAKKSQRHANMMKFIDDKFSLITNSNVSSNRTSPLPSTEKLSADFDDVKEHRLVTSEIV